MDVLNWWHMPTLIGLAIIIVCPILLILIFRPQKHRPRQPDQPRGKVVIDGSNVMYWKTDTPKSQLSAKS